MQLRVVADFVLVFSFLVAPMMQASTFEMMAVLPGCAAGLTVFVSNGP